MDNNTSLLQAKNLLTILAIVVLVLITLIFVYFEPLELFNGKVQDTTMVERTSSITVENSGLNDNPKSRGDVTGFLLLSGLRTDSDKFTVYSLDLSGNLAEYKSYADFLPYAAFPEFTDSKNIEGVWFRTISAESFNASPVPDRIHYYDFTNSDLTFYNGAAGANPRNYAWSKDGNLLAYNRFVEFVTADNPKFIEIDNYEVVIFSPASEAIELVIEDAMQPQWLPDGKSLIYLRDDGLYALNPELSSERRILSFTAGANREPPFVDASTMIDLSSDGTKFIWSNGRYGTIFIYNIEYLDGFPRLSRLGTIAHRGETEYYWPTFSPSGDFYAIQAIDYADDVFARTNPRIEIRDFNSREVITSYPLDGFNFNALFTDTWIDFSPSLPSLESLR